MPKGKKIDPSRIELQYRVMNAELRTIEKRVLGTNESAERSFISSLRSRDARKMIASAKSMYHLSEQMKLFSEINQALNELNSDANAIALNVTPFSVHENAFRIVIMSAFYFKLECATQFQLIAKDLFGSQISTLVDSNKLPQNVRHALSDESLCKPAEADLKLFIQRFANRKNLSISSIESTMGFSLSTTPISTPISPTISTPVSTPVSPPISTPVSPPISSLNQPQSYNKANEISGLQKTTPPLQSVQTGFNTLQAQSQQRSSLYIPIPMKPFPRQIWASMLVNLSSALK